MSEDLAGKKLKKLTGTKYLSTAIEKLEKKKKALEDDLKSEAKNLYENLNPVTLLDKTLKSVEESSSEKYSLVKEAVAFGAGYLSKKNWVHQIKTALIHTFMNSENLNNRI